MIAKKDRLNAIIWVLIAGVFITLLKFYAYYLTHSNAILTDALENIINIIAGSFAFYSIYLSYLFSILLSISFIHFLSLSLPI
jgi:divalent metal cation (Fe/Co/Zn/Cd) transporter